MKKITSLLSSVLFCTLLFAQTVPQGINYQAVARDASGNELINQPLTIQFSIIEDVLAGTISWQETHSVITNDYGLFTAIIGNGVSTGSGTSGSFALIDWSSLPHFLKVEIDDGWGYVDMGTTAFMSVPYALRAENISDPLWENSGSATQNTNTDKVVIATSTSGEGLEVVDNVSGISIQDLDDNTEIAIWAPGNGYTGGIGTMSQHDLTFFTANSDHLKLTTNGKFGVGNMSPSYDLDVTGDINFSGDLYQNGSLFSAGDNLGNHAATQDLDMDYNDIDNIESIHLKNLNASGSTRIDFVDNIGNGVCGIQVGNSGWVYGEAMDIFNNRGDISLTSGSDDLLIYVNDILVDADDINFEGNNGNTMIKIEANESSTTGAQINLNKYDGTNTISIDADYNGAGRIITEELQITGGADFAESFDISYDNVEVLAGMAVSINTEQAGALTLADTEYDKKVIGIISGANDINPGMIMGQKGSIANGEYPVAITGRVYAYATNINGEIEPGDLLTTSSKPGYLMKVTDKDKAFGSIVGKAMTSWDQEHGFV
jgi:hypothetical protein